MQERYLEREFANVLVVAPVCRYSRPVQKETEIRELAKKRRARRAWTKEDVRTLKSMAKAKSGVKRIAKTLKRTPGATSVKATSLGISLSMK